MSNLSLPGSTHLKMALIPVLGAVFLTQLWPRRDTPEGPTAGAANPVVSNPARPAPSAEQQPRLAPTPRSWPRADLAAVLQHNPFAVPSVLQPPPPPASPPAPVPIMPSAAVDEPLSALVAIQAAAPDIPVAASGPRAETRAVKVVQLESKRVSVVLVSPTGASAVVDSKVYRVNDYLEPGVQIAEIRPDAVIVHVQENPYDVESQNLPEPH